MILLTAVLVSTSGTTAVKAAPLAAAKKKKIPSASSQLSKAFRALKKTKNYTIEASVLGGLSNNPEHKVVKRSVTETYGASIFQGAREPIMHIPRIRAYKMPKPGKGVIFDGGEWRRILSTKTGVKMDRLVGFPNLILAEAMKYAKTARWLPKDEVPKGFTFSDKSVEEEDTDDDEESSDRNKKGRTAVRKSSKSDKDTSRPRVLRVEAHPKQALSIWIKRVENSGCMKDG